MSDGVPTVCEVPGYYVRNTKLLKFSQRPQSLGLDLSTKQGVLRA